MQERLLEGGVFSQSLGCGLIGERARPSIGRVPFFVFFLSQMTKNDCLKEGYSPCRIIGHLDVGLLGKGPSHGLRLYTWSLFSQ